LLKRGGIWDWGSRAEGEQKGSRTRPERKGIAWERGKSLLLGKKWRLGEKPGK